MAVDKSKLLETLKIYGEAILLECINNLNKAGKGGGKLSKSLQYRIYEFGVEILSNVDYAYYVEKGRKAGKQPPLKAIEGWIETSGLPIPKTAAFAIARNIGRFGIKPSNFIADAMKTTAIPLRREIKRTVKQLYTESLKEAAK